MIVYVETNFVIELIRRQEEYGSCESLMQLAGHGEIELRLPAFCLVEAGEVLRRLRKEYTDLLDRIDTTLRDFRRGEQTQVFEADVQRSRMAVTGVIDEETKAFESVRPRIHEQVTVIPLNHAAARRNEPLASLDVLANRPGDRIVLSSILADAESTADSSIFVTRDRDFRSDDIRELLQTVHCRPFFSYHAAVAFLHHHS